MKTRMSPTGSETQRGMTLLELLVVLVIASLMMTLIAPNIANVLPGSELKAFARQSAALLRELRSEAVNRSRVMGLAADEENRIYRSGNRTLASWPEGISIEVDQGEAASYMIGPVTSLNMVLFFPDGSSSGGKLKIRSEGSGSYEINVDALTGGVSLHGS